MQFRWILCLVTVLLQLSSCHGYNILVYISQNGRGQATYLGQLADILVDAGHSVTVLLVQHNPDVPAVGIENAKIITVEADEKVATYFKNDDSIAEMWTLNAASSIGQRKLALDYAQTFVDQCAHTTKQTELIKELHSQNFDLMLHELFDHCQLGLMQMLGIHKHVALQSPVMFEAVTEAIGGPNVPSLAPAVGAAGNNLTIFEKMINLVHVTISKEAFNVIVSGQEEIFERVLRYNFESFQRKMDNVSYVLSNSDPLIDVAHNLDSRVLEIGGIAVRKPNKLNEEWRQILDQRETILISFGSVATSHSMPEEFKNAFLELFTQLPQFTFVWKFETENPDFLHGLSNVHTRKWIPQNDILSHPNVKLFLGHGGMNTVLEAAHRGVPMLLVPLFADHMRNAKMMEAAGSALSFDRFELGNGAKLTEGVRKVLMETRYSKTAKRIASMLGDRPINLTETFVRHVEFAAKYGPIHNVGSPASRTNFISYYLIDVAFAVFGFVVVFVCAVYCTTLSPSLIALCSPNRSLRSMRWVLCFLLLSALPAVSGYKILVYSQKNGRSQVIFMGQITDMLVEAGHDVTVLQVEMNHEVTVNATDKAKVITIPAAPKVKKFFEEEATKEFVWFMDVSNPFAQAPFIREYGAMMADQCEFTATHQSLFTELRNEKFDLMVHELFDHCQLGIMQAIGVHKHVGLQSTILFEGVGEVVGVPSIPSIVPAVFATQGSRMTLLERVINVIETEVGKSLITVNWNAEESIYRRVLGDRFTPFQDVVDNMTFLITNSDPFLDFSHPINSKVVELGGLCVKDPKPLSEEWLKVLGKRDKVVLLSFGSIAKSITLPMHFKRAIAEVIAGFPDVTFVWKYESDEQDFLDGIPNVHTSKWVPQNDVLNHPNVKLFITHGGMGSFLEASHWGVPIVGIPLFADQMRNVKSAEALGTGVFYERLDLGNAEKLKAVVSKVLTTRSYEVNAKRVSSLISNRPVDLKQSFIRHIEFAAKYGAIPSMTSVAPKVNFFSYYMLDALAVAVLVCVSVLVIQYLILGKIVSLLSVFVNIAKVKPKMS